jgi:hypothetical protein
MKKLTLVLLGLLFCIPSMMAQGITTHQYRRVEPQNMAEYLKRETTYWQKLAESEVTKGNLTFWAILQKVGGLDQENGSNILIVNSFNNMDTANDIWGNVQALFPDKKMEDINTDGLAKNTATIFLRDLNNHVQGANVDPEKDFNYVYILYHNSKDMAKHLTFEAEKWKPMAKKAMDEGKTTMKGWGNSVVVSPESNKFPYSSSSYDLYASVTDALGPGFSEDFVWPDNFFADVTDNPAGPRHKNLYRIVAVVSSPSE